MKHNISGHHNNSRKSRQPKNSYTPCGFGISPCLYFNNHEIVGEAGGMSVAKYGAFMKNSLHECKQKQNANIKRDGVGSNRGKQQ